MSLPAPIFSDTMKSMGAGVGKTRRARSSVQEIVTAQINSMLWFDFVDGSMLENVTLADYYKVKKTVDEPEQLKLAAEILCDLVDLGAINLPRGKWVQDFVFDIEDARVMDSQAGSRSRLVLRTPYSDGDIHSAHIIYAPSSDLNAQSTMGSSEVTRFVFGVLAGVEDLLS